MFWIILATILPFCCFVVGILSARFLGSFGYFVLVVSHLSLSMFIYLCLIFYHLTDLVFLYKITIFSIHFSNNYIVSFGLFIDSLSLFVVFVVLVITLCVQVYTKGYLANDIYLYKFYIYITAFCLAMMLLVLSSNLIQFFIGWELVGICSFLLISFWSTRLEAVRAGIKAILLNKIGDVGFVIGMGILINMFHTLDFDSIYMLISIPVMQEYALILYDYKINAFECCMFGFLVAVMAKSAQFGFHSWLLDAMEGPTPVSALLHSATMVVAGVYLLLRLSPLLVFTSVAAKVLIIVGGITCILAAWCALWVYDIKKIIAFSTCSQLGLMVSGCGMLAHTSVLNHLIQHAFFKALLFLLAGNIIHACNNEQDIRKMGEIWRVMPITATLFIISSCALCAFPFLSGFYSKEALLFDGGCSIFSGNLFECFGFLTCFFGSALTLVYTIRLLFYVFIDYYRGGTADKEVSKTMREPCWAMLGVCILLSMVAIFGGYFFKNIFNTLYLDFFFCTLNLGYSADLLDNEFCTRRHYITIFLWLSLKQGCLVWLLWLGILGLNRLVARQQRLLVEFLWRLDSYYKWPFKTAAGFDLLWNLILIEFRQFFSTQFYLITVYENIVKIMHNFFYFILREIERGLFEYLLVWNIKLWRLLFFSGSLGFIKINRVYQFNLLILAGVCVLVLLFLSPPCYIFIETAIRGVFLNLDLI